MAQNPDLMLFDVKRDPHEQHDLSSERLDLVAKAMMLLEQWQVEMMRTATHPQDPLRTVLFEGGPYHNKVNLPRYLDRLRQTGREVWARRLAAAHPDQC